MSEFVDTVEQIQRATQYGLQIEIGNDAKGVTIKPPEGCGYFIGVPIHSARELEMYINGFLSGFKVQEEKDQGEDE